jgi:methylated-DNA-[protein]-cysteine S-methyltransferase
MVNVLLVEGILSDGLPMRLWLASRQRHLIRTSLNDNLHTCTQDEFVWRCHLHRGEQIGHNNEPALQEAANQASEYFSGRRLAFDLPLDLAGTAFQVRVWNELCRIPFGQMRSYGEIAEAIGAPGAARAVGRANGSNRLALIVPCHRVIASGGKLGGYTGGIGLKQRLLAHEAAVLGRRVAAA